MFTVYRSTPSGAAKFGLQLRHLGSLAVAEKAGLLKGGGAGAVRVSVGERDGWRKRMTCDKSRNGEMER